MPPFPNKFKGGGKTGMRQNTGKKRAGAKLLPPPSTTDLNASRQDAIKRRRPGMAQLPEPDQQLDHSEEEEEEEETATSYRNSIKVQRKPLHGLTITVSGCSGTKQALMDLARELGATVQPSLTADTTHLIADTAGSAKFDMAVRCRMKIMLPDWLSKLQGAYTAGEDLDVDDLEIQHMMPPLYGTEIALTQFAAGPHRTNISTLLRNSGAIVHTKLDTFITHLLVASPTSPHSPTPNTEKLEHAIRNPRSFTAPGGLKVVWEGWLNEVLEQGGRRSDREVLWKWEKGGQEPSEEMLKEEDVLAMERKRMVRETTTLLGVDGAEGGGKGKGKRKVEEKDDLAVLVPKTKDSRKGEKDHLPMNTLLDGFFSQAANASQVNASTSTSSRPLGPSTKTLAAFALSTTTTDDKNYDADISSTTPFETVIKENDRNSQQDLAMEFRVGEGLKLLPKGKSVIKAIESRRSNSSFSETTTRKTSSSTRRKAFVGPRRSLGSPELAPGGGAEGEANDSAFFDSVSQLADLVENQHPSKPLPRPPPHSSASSKEDTEPDLPIFEGVKFSLMGMNKEENREVVKKGIEKRGGVVRVEEGVEEADWVVVDYFGAPMEFVESDDPRIVTGCWIELCIFDDKIVEPEDRLLERPLPYSVPIKGAEKMSIHTSNFSDVESVHLRRFITEIGATFTTTFSRSTTHLLHGSVDQEGVEPSGIKVEKAKQWGTVLRGVKWLREWALEEGMKGVMKGEEKGRKGVGRDLTNEGSARSEKRSISRKSREETEEQRQGSVEGGILNECSILFSSKIDRADRPRLTELITSLGGSISKSFSPSSTTHLLHIGTRQSETFSDFKKAKEAKMPIVHPKWLEECDELGQIANELDFPHTFDPKKGRQLAQVVASPPRNSPPSRSHSFVGAAPTVMEEEGGDVSMSEEVDEEKEEVEAPLPPRLKASDFGLSEEELGTKRRRRRSETEVEEEQVVVAQPEEEEEEMGGGMAPEDHQAVVGSPSSPFVPARDPSRRSSPSPSPRRPQQHQSQLQNPPSTSSPPRSDHIVRPPALEVEDPSSDAPMPAPIPEKERKALLKEKTSLLLAQLQNEVGVAQQQQGKGRGIGRKRSTNSEGNNSTTTSVANLSTTLTTGGGSNTTSNDSSTSFHHPAPRSDASSSTRRLPGMGYLEPSQQTQDEDSMYRISFDDPAEVKAREDIQKLLGGGGGAMGGRKRGREIVQDEEREVEDGEEEEEDVVVLAQSQVGKRRRSTRGT